MQIQQQDFIIENMGFSLYFVGATIGRPLQFIGISGGRPMVALTYHRIDII